eukprot:TRINITY_DN245_c0_g1_i1.p1 TRINITY_DN245_c0_g1~~TRINITY_DN245_c0_g1_i1.p1  ORF type:complete len:198 (-),score=66.90 TRINITY_DN245_c0_g1_i1:176-769(-)
MCIRDRYQRRVHGESNPFRGRRSMVLIPKSHKILVYEYLLKEGVICVKKDFGLPKHPDIAVPNIHVLMMLKTLKSKGLVELVFNWRHYYYFLLKEGVTFVRQQLGIAEEVYPDTYKESTTHMVIYEDREEGDRPQRPRGPRGEGRGRGGRGGRGRGGRGMRGGRGRRPEGEGRGEEAPEEGVEEGQQQQEGGEVAQE